MLLFFFLNFILEEACGFVSWSKVGEFGSIHASWNRDYPAEEKSRGRKPRDRVHRSSESANVATQRSVTQTSKPLHSLRMSIFIIVHVALRCIALQVQLSAFYEALDSAKAAVSAAISTSSVGDGTRNDAAPAVPAPAAHAPAAPAPTAAAVVGKMEAAADHLFASLKGEVVPHDPLEEYYSKPGRPSPQELLFRLFEGHLDLLAGAWNDETWQAKIGAIKERFQNKFKLGMGGPSSFLDVKGLSFADDKVFKRGSHTHTHTLIDTYTHTRILK